MLYNIVFIPFPWGPMGDFITKSPLSLVASLCPTQSALSIAQCVIVSMGHVDNIAKWMPKLTAMNESCVPEGLSVHQAFILISFHTHEITYLLLWLVALPQGETLVWECILNPDCISPAAAFCACICVLLLKRDWPFPPKACVALDTQSF